MLKNTLYDLSHLSALNILGDNASTFLQGQLSCDVNAVDTHQMRPSAFCNLKGRVLALPDVLEFNHILRLILPRNLLEQTQKSLSKTAALSRVTLEPEKNYHVFGFYLKDINQPLPFEGPWPTEKYAVHTSGNHCAYYLGHHCYILLVHQNNLNPIKATQNAAAWHQLRLAQGNIQIYPESRGLFLPHRLDLHLSEHLNFNKGCYKGQEIIARMHYKAKHKHTLKIFTLKTDTPPTQGLRLINQESQQEVGEVVDFCFINPNQYLIAASVLLEADPALITLKI